MFFFVCVGKLQVTSRTNHCHVSIPGEGEDIIVKEVSEMFSSGTNSK